MNNLTLSCIALGSAGLIWLSQHNSLEAARTNQRMLHKELAAARATLAETTASVTSAEDLLALRRKKLDGARTESAATAVERVTPIPLDPAREGLWPKDKPYCYLSKQHLATIGFTPFSEDERLTSEAARLFGMSRAEWTAADRAYADLLDRTHELQLAHVELIATNAAANTENHREITYCMPALTNEFRALRATFASSLEQALGSSRANIFLKRANSQLDDMYGQYGNNGYTLKYSADRQPDGTVEHQLHIQKLDRSASNGYGDLRFPIEPASPMWNYRHLIGDQPLLVTAAAEAN
jgi:hypothetical protein